MDHRPVAMPTPSPGLAEVRSAMPNPRAAVISDSNRVKAKKVTTPAITAPQEMLRGLPSRSSPRAVSFQDGLGAW